MTKKEEGENVQTKAGAIRLRAELRRQHVFKYLAQGLTQCDIARVLGVHRNTIGNDIDALGKLLSKDLEKGPLRQLIRFQALTNTALRKLVALYDEAETVREKKEILKEIREAGEQQIKVLQSLGMIQKAPEKLEIESTMEVNVGINDRIKEYADVFDKLAKRRA